MARILKAICLLGLFLIPASSHAALAQPKEVTTRELTQDWARFITIGPGMPAVSFRFDGKIGILDKVVPLEVTLNFKQLIYKETKLILWRVAFGFTLGKAAGQDGAQFGAYLMPWGVQLNNFATGIGLGYNAVDQVQWEAENFSIILPVTYTVEF